MVEQDVVWRLHAFRDFSYHEIHHEMARALFGEAADEIERLREALAKIQRNAWCYIPGDDHVYNYPLEWAEYDLDAKLSPHIEQFGWAGHLPMVYPLL